MAAAQYQDIRNRVARQLEGALWMDPADPLNAPENTLWFYGHRASYGCFSNFYHTPIVIGKHTWPTSEHYFQAMKFEHSFKDFKEILHAKGPMEAAKMGRERSRPLRPDWAGVKDDIMFDVVLAKFTQDATIRDILLSTGDLVLVEHTGNDAYWGDGGDGSGKNMLGITLCQVREVLRTFPVEDVAAQAAGPLVPSRVPGVSDIRQAVLDASKNITWVLDNGDQPPNTLHFYRDKSEFGYLSNFFAVPVTFAGAVWPTTEHYFQAMKFEHSKPHYEAVLAAASPMEAKNLGGDRSSPLRKDWEAVKDNIMFDIVFAKFTQVPELRDELLSTGDLVLVEHTKNDSYWGDGGDGTGKNMLGITLMQVRECIRRGFTSF